VKSVFDKVAFVNQMEHHWQKLEFAYQMKQLDFICFHYFIFIFYILYFIFLYLYIILFNFFQDVHKVPSNRPQL
jgi:hypothetical protein